MTEQTITVPEPDATITAALPPVPQPDTCDDGYDWMEQLVSPWWPLSGFMGDMIGDWPDVCVALYTDRAGDEYGIAVWDSGTVTVYGYADEARRMEAVRAYVTEG